MATGISETTHTCKNCGNVFEGKFCNRCGEKVYVENDRSFRKLMHEAFHFLTHFEGTFLVSLKTILLKPGKISYDFCSGLRKKYFKPLSFFLFMVILYLLFPLFEGLNMRLRYHKMHDMYGAYAIKQAEKVQEQKHYTDEEMEEAFHHKGEKASKFLLFIILPFAALVSYALGFKKRKYYFDHFIFATEVTSFGILWVFLILPFTVGVIRIISPFNFLTEAVLVVISCVGIIAYALLAVRRFFELRWIYTIPFAVVYFCAIVMFVQYIYKFVLFYTVIHIV